MKRAALGALLISLVAGSTAMAGIVLPPDFNQRKHDQRHATDHRDHRNDRGHDRNDRRSEGKRNDDRRRQDNRRDDHRWDGRRDDHRYNDRRYNDHRWDPTPRHDRRLERGRWHWGAYHRPHGYVHHHWVRGDRLPRPYYASHYVIRDYRYCGLRHPPHGYHWVRVNNDAVLAVIATGVVLDVVYNQFW